MFRRYGPLIGLSAPSVSRAPFSQPLQRADQDTDIPWVGWILFATTLTLIFLWWWVGRRREQTGTRTDYFELPSWPGEEQAPVTEKTPPPSSADRPMQPPAEGRAGVADEGARMAAAAPRGPGEPPPLTVEVSKRPIPPLDVARPVPAVEKDAVGVQEEKDEVEQMSAPTAERHGPTERDDLKRIEGIGPKVAELLHNSGFTTFARLAEADVEDLRRILKDSGLAMMNPASWPEQARLAADGAWEKLERLQSELKGGRKP